MRKRWNIMIATLCLALMTGACSGEADSEYKTEAEKKLESSGEVEEKEYQKKLDVIKPAAYGNVEGLTLEKGSYISIIGKGSDGEYWEQVKKGAEQAAADINAERGYEGKDEVKVTYSGPSDAGDVDEQVNILDEELARYPVGVGISIVDSQACGVQFDLAAENGIPVVAMDSGSDYKGLMATVSTNNKVTAQTAAEKTAELIGGKGKVLVFVQDSKSMSAEERESGFTEKIKEDYPDVVIEEVYHMDQLEETKKLIVMEKEKLKKKEVTDEMLEEITTEEALDLILKEHPDVKGIFATDGTTVQDVAAALARAEREDVTVTGYDGNKEELEALESGMVDGLIIQNPFGMGYASVVAAARAALSMGNEAYVNTGSMWVTRENLNSDDVKAWLYE